MMMQPSRPDTLSPNDPQQRQMSTKHPKRWLPLTLIGWVLVLCVVGWNIAACGPPTTTETGKEFVFPKVDSGPSETPQADNLTETPQADTGPDSRTPPIDTTPLPPGTWPTSGGGASSDFGKQITIDKAGNIYITGDFEETITFGAHTITAQKGADVFVAKLDSTGKFLWAVSGGSGGYDNALGIAVDAKGQVYITGKIDGDASFGATSLASIGFTDIFIAKVSAAGKWEWAKVAGNINADGGESITMAPNGDILVTGSFRGNGKFGAKTLKAGPNDNLFVARLDAAGNWKWATARNDENSAAPAFGIGADAKGNAYITGYYVGTARFGGTQLKPSGGFDTYIAKINKDGSWGWATPAAIPGPDSGRGIAVHADGSSTIIGRYEGTGKLGATDVSSKGKKDVFVAHIGPDGSFVWAKSYGSDSFDFARAIATDASGNIYASSTYQGSISVGGESFQAGKKDNILLVKLDKSGKIAWAKDAGGDGFDAGFGIAATAAGVPFITGYFQGTATFDGDKLQSKGLDDVFVWRVKVP